VLHKIDAKIVKRNNERIKRKRTNEGISSRKDTLIKKAYELGEFDGVDVTLITCKHGRYTTYRSKDDASWPPSIAEIVSSARLIHATVAATDLAHCLSSEECNATRHGKASL